VRRKKAQKVARRGRLVLVRAQGARERERGENMEV
jgi:hypothetical protein